MEEKQKTKEQRMNELAKMHQGTTEAGAQEADRRSKPTRRWLIGHKLTVASVLMVLLTLLSGVVGLWQVLTIGQVINEAHQKEQQLTWSLELLVAGHRLVGALDHMLVTQDSLLTSTDVPTSLGILRFYMETLQETGGEAETSDPLEKMQVAYNELLQAVHEVDLLARQELWMEAGVVLEQEVRPANEHMGRLIQSLVRQADRDVETMAARTQVVIRQAALLLVVLVVLTTAIALGWRQTVFQEMTHSITELRQGVARISSGDLEYKLDVRTGDEIEELGDEFNKMAAKLANVIGSLEQRVAERTQALAYRSLQLETAAQISEAVSSILEPDELERQAVELIRQRFDYYYVGLFLVDESSEWTSEPGRWAVLRAGTGEAGRHMLKQGHKLEIGGTSMISWCIANKQARIALDVTSTSLRAEPQAEGSVEPGEEAIRFDNPLLPETRSELALPLISRGQAIGALTIQSSQKATFSEEDIAVLQTMADQLANAIANAQLYDQAQREIAERKAAEEALRVSEERFALAVQGSNDGIYDWDIVNNTLYWSPRLKEMLGYADDELDIDFETFDSLLHPDDKEHTNAAIEAHLKDRGLYHVEQRLLAKSGEYIWTRARGQAVWDEDGQLIRMVGSTTDITERKEAEEKIEHLNLVLSAIRNVNQLITRERDRDRLLQDACETLIETRGYHSAWIALLDESGGHVLSDVEGVVTTAEAGLGEDFLPLVERLERNELIDCVQRALKQSGVVVTQDPSSACADCPLSSTYDGRGAVTIRLEYSGKVYGLLSVSIPRDLAADEEERALFEEVAGDIAFALHSVELEEEHKAADEALAYERHLLKTLMDNLPDAIYFKDTDSRFIRTNKAHAKRWFGLSDPEQAVGKTDFDFFSEEHAQQAYADEQEIVRTGQPLINMEEKETWPDGRVTWVSTTKMPLRDAEGYIIGTFGITRDITERKAAEEALKEYSEQLEEMVEERTQKLQEAQEELIRKEKLAVLGQLAGGVGHELRNPLGAIKNAAYFLNMVLEEPEPDVKETLEILDKEVATSESVISSLLDFARTKRPAWRKVDLSAVIQETLSRVAVPGNVEVVSQLGGKLPIILADPDQLAQVFGNIILNAVQAMPEGGRLLVKSEVPNPDWVTVSIADTGVGIPKENLGKLFEPLFTTKAKGVGLGLAVVKTLVEGHGGTIEVESEMGIGTTFTVRLPMPA